MVHSCSTKNNDNNVSKIALSAAKDIDREEIKEKYRTLFREKLNPEGKPYV